MEIIPYIATGLSVVGKIQESAAQSASLKAQSQAAAYNQQIAERNARLTEQQTQQQVDEADRQRRLRLGANIAAMGASGISGGSGLDILSDNITQETLDILNIKREGLLRAQDYRIQGGMYGAESQNYLNQRPSMASTIMGATSAGIKSAYNTGILE